MSLQLGLTVYRENTTEQVVMEKHHAFDLVRYEVTLNNKMYQCCPHAVYENITYTLYLQRDPHGIAHLIVAPCVLLNLFLPFLFLLPPEQDEKIQFGVGFLVSNTLLMLMLVDFLPSGHPTLPVIAHYHTSNIILSTLGLAVAACIRNLWSKGQRGAHMPNLVKNYVLYFCGRLVCVSRDQYMPVLGVSPDQSLRQLEVISGEMPEDVESSANDREQILMKYARQSQSAEWKQLAVALDRICFVFFAVICIVFSVALTTM